MAFLFMWWELGLELHGQNVKHVPNIIQDLTLSLQLENCQSFSLNVWSWHHEADFKLDGFECCIPNLSKTLMVNALEKLKA